VRRDRVGLLCWRCSLRLRRKFLAYKLLGALSRKVDCLDLPLGGIEAGLRAPDKELVVGGIDAGENVARRHVLPISTRRSVILPLMRKPRFISVRARTERSTRVRGCSGPGLSRPP